jgi:hypothetical protein
MFPIEYGTRVLVITGLVEGGGTVAAVAVVAVVVVAGVVLGVIEVEEETESEGGVVTLLKEKSKVK